MYEAKVEDSKIILTPPSDPAFSGLKKKEIPLSDVADTVGFIESADAFGHGGETTSGYLHLKGQEFSEFVYGLRLQEIRDNAKSLVEIDGISGMIPMELLFDEPREESDERVDAFLRQVFNDIATGKENRDGYKTQAFINPAAVESVEDEGNYRRINIKPEYGKSTGVISALSADDLKKRLGLKPPSA